MSDVPIFTFAIIIFGGILTSRAAEIWKFPKVIALISTGIALTLLSTILNLDLDLTAFSDITLLTAEMTLILILFNEGLHLNLKNLRENSLVVSVIAVVGTLLTTMMVGLTIDLFPAIQLTLLALFLVGAIISPTDPAATFGIIRSGGTRIKRKIEVILCGESTFNDIIAILLVVIVIIPLLVGDRSSFGIVIGLGVWSAMSGIMLGIIIAALTLLTVPFIDKPSEIPFITLTGIFFIFAISGAIGGSSAMAAVIYGILIRNPRYIGSTTSFKLGPMYEFWDNIIFLFEIVSFVLIGLLLQIEYLQQYILVAIIVSGVILVGRIVVIFVITLPFEISKNLRSSLSNGERLFIGVAGLKGLTTAILALFAFVSLESIDIDLAALILNVSIISILITGTIQGLIIRPLARQTGVLDKLNPIDELNAQRIAKEVKLQKLIDDLANKNITENTFRRLSYPLKEELYLIENRLEYLEAQEKSELEYMQYQVDLLRNTINVLKQSRKSKEITEAAYRSVVENYKSRLAALERILEKNEELSQTDELDHQEQIKTESVDITLMENIIDSIRRISKHRRIPELRKARRLVRQSVVEMKHDLEKETSTLDSKK